MKETNNEKNTFFEPQTHFNPLDRAIFQYLYTVTYTNFNNHTPKRINKKNESV